MRIFIFYSLMICAGLSSCSEKIHPGDPVKDSLQKLAEQFPKRIDADFFKTDTASFYALDQSGLSLDERKALVRRAIAESKIDTMGYAFFERRFDADDRLQTYEDMHNSDTGLVNGNGRVGIIVTDINGDAEKDLVVRYSNGADDNACFYFVQKNGRFQHPLISGAYVTSIERKNERIQKIREVSFACCDNPFNTYTESVFKDSVFTDVLQIQAVHWMDSIPTLRLIGTTTSRKGALLRPNPEHHPDEASGKSFRSGDLPLGEPNLLGVYREQVINGESWLLVLCHAARYPFFYLGWIAKADTDWK